MSTTPEDGGIVDGFEQTTEEREQEAFEDGTEPGAEGPIGTGVEGADDILEAERQGDDDGIDSADLHPRFAPDEVAAAEQGNRIGDEMASGGGDAAEVAELTGDTLDVDELSDDGIRAVSDVDGLDVATGHVFDDSQE